MKYLLRASLSRNLHSWFTWLFSESVVKARGVSEAFYVSWRKVGGDLMLPRGVAMWLPLNNRSFHLTTSLYHCCLKQTSGNLTYIQIYNEKNKVYI